MATAFQSYLSNQVTVAGRSGCPERARVILCPGCDPQLGHPADLQDLHSALQLVLGHWLMFFLSVTVQTGDFETVAVWFIAGAIF